MNRFSGDDDEEWATAYSLRVALRKLMMQEGIPSGVRRLIEKASHESNLHVCGGCGEWRNVCDCDGRREFDE